MRLLSKLLRKLIRKGHLRLYDAGGTPHTFGGEGPGPNVTARFHKRSLETSLLLNPELRLAEAYIDGALTFENGSTVNDCLRLLAVNSGELAANASRGMVPRIFQALSRWRQANMVKTGAAHARGHYDISIDLYRLFLDEDLHYSCGYFRDPERDTLEEAQRYKLIHATTKLKIEPGMRVVEIGSGWGSFAIHLAKETGARVVALNASPEQTKVARERTEQAGVAHLVEFSDLDYRNLSGPFDRVVSIEMMEHVGIGRFDEYFGKVRELLTDDGFGFVHCIGRSTPPGSTGPFIRKYVFPDAYVPALSEVLASVERNGLRTLDLEILRSHYAHTARHWHERFAANRERAKLVRDERFCRMWEFFLAGIELGHLYGPLMVFQLLVGGQRNAAPITRDFMVDAERAVLRI